MFNFKSKVKIKKALQIFFIVKNLNPIFFELLIDSIKGFNKKKRVVKLRNSNQIIILLSIYLNLFSTKKINTQKNEKRIYININRVDLIKEKQRLLSKVLKKELEPRYKVSFIPLYLSRYNKINTSQLIESRQVLENLKML